MSKYLTDGEDTSKLGGWVRFYRGFGSSFYIEKAGYFDERPRLNVTLTGLLFLLIFPILLNFSFWFLLTLPLLFFGWGRLHIYLPIRTGIQDCDSAAWGFNYHNNKIWIYIGGGGNYEGGKKWKTITMPWELKWHRTSLMLSYNTWEHEFKGSRKDFYDECWVKKRWQIRANYLDEHDSTWVGATLYITEREWRPIAFKWTSLFSKVRRTLEANFDKEIGSGKGSWKGGITQKGFTISSSLDILESIESLGFETTQLKREDKLNKLDIF